MTKKELVFIDTVYAYYKNNGRHDLPWRKTHDPYCILVSEIMLQQTQVHRVVPKYNLFIQQYPTVQKLAKASLADVLILWQGLGYNRRAKMLLSCSQMVVRNYSGLFPDSEKKLLLLPGIGPYTANAILAFAFNTTVSLIETNVRSVYLHHFFKNGVDISDAEILGLVTATNDVENPRSWYYALMDYGSYLKKEFGNPNSKSKHYTKQSTFKNSDRQIRGAIIRVLSKSSVSRVQLLAILSMFENIRVDAQVEKLLTEKMITKIKSKYYLPK